MNTAQELLILAVQTKTRLRSLGDGLLIFPGEGLPEDAVRRFRDAEDELAKLVEELFAHELSEAEQEQMGREMYEEYCERERAELEAKGICPHCRGTRVFCDDDGAPDGPCVECVGEQFGEFVDDVTQEPDGSPEPHESSQVPLDPVAVAPSPEAS